MTFEKWTITDLVTLLTSIGLGISLVSQTYLYYRLDALWIISILPISVYFLDVLRVGFITCLIFIFVVLIHLVYSLIFKKILRVRIRVPSGYDVSKFLNIQKERHSKYFSWITIILAQFVFALLRYLGFSVPTSIQYWTSFIVGMILAILLNGNLNTGLRRFFLGVIVICVTGLNAEIKLNQIENNPYVHYRDQSGTTVKKSKLLDAYQDKVIILEKNSSQTIIKILKIEQIEKIVSDEFNH